jgi:murein DD-endopeptidase MepM/ murein hydrolase activator NlpD
MGDKKNWVGFGTPVVAPADGTILEAVGDLPDDIPFNEEQMMKNPALEEGNHILIDHGNGEFSMMAHFQQGGVLVRKGDHVRQGQVIGRMSRSGMGSMLVHVHYQLQNGPDPNTAEALPMELADVQQVGAARSSRSRIDAGWIIVTKK